MKGGNMRKGFTLLELLIVIIIVGIMATLGLTQYTATVERSRGAEARQILGQLRTVCAALYLDSNNVTACTLGGGANLSLGTGAAGTHTIPSSACAVSHYFLYTAVPDPAPNVLSLRAQRCPAGGAGKDPGFGSSDRYLNLTVDYSAGTGIWVSPNGY